MRALDNFDSHIIGRTPVVFDEAYVGWLNFMASERVHGASRLARFLRQEAANATILPSDRMPVDVVNFGSEVTYRDEASGRAYTVRLTMPGDADIREHRVSVLTPVGTALIGRTQGAVVDCEFPVGTMRQLTILHVASDAPAQPGAAVIADEPVDRAPETASLASDATGLNASA